MLQLTSRRIEQRVEPTQQYELEKQAWLQNHPEATPQEYEQAIREIAARLNY